MIHTHVRRPESALRAAKDQPRNVGDRGGLRPATALVLALDGVIRGGEAA